MSYANPFDNRLTGLTGTDAERILTAAAGAILRGEMHFTSDSLRGFYENRVFAPVVHGADVPIADEAAMLALNATQERKCHRADVCIRADSTIWLCIAGRGTLIGQWKQIGGPVEVQGQWVPVSNGDPANPSLLCDEEGNLIFTYIPAADLPPIPV